jgi:hypothetical protein
MKRVIIAVGLLGLTLAGSAVLRRDHRSEPWRAGMSGSGFAVVELFTSEGCSSCPPADELIAKVQQEDKDLPVYVLAFHVDYWDRLGWKDVFSDAAYTDRQKRYASWLKLSTIYTPQVVVNGQTECVGSQAVVLYMAIKNALQQSGDVQLLLSGLRLNGKRLEWTCNTQGGTPAQTGGGKNLQLMVAVVETSAVTRVRGGENSGKTLSHVQIVRGLGQSPVDAKGQSTGYLDWPARVKPTDGEVIAFLQDQDSGQIIAATRSAVTP